MNFDDQIGMGTNQPPQPNSYGQPQQTQFNQPVQQAPQQYNQQPQQVYSQPAAQAPQQQSYGASPVNNAPMNHPPMQAAAPQQAPAPAYVPPHQGGQQQGGYQKPAYNGGGNQGGYQKPAYNGGGGGGYQKPAYNGGGGGGYQNKQGGGGFNRGGGGFQRPVEDLTNYIMYRPYAVTGNRDTPQEVINRVRSLVTDLEKLGYVMRSGGMDGLEDAAEKATTLHEIHLPWRGFSEKESKFTYSSEACALIAKKYHPTYDQLKPALQAFLHKNVRIVLGKDLHSPALFMICWTEDGAETTRQRTARTGPTGHAIAVAAALGIPVFNMGNPDAEDRIKRYMTENNVQEQIPPVQ